MGSMQVKVLAQSFFTPFFGFLHLLFYADPTWLDKLLVGAGFITAIAAGVPFPLIGILFGQLVDDLNSATCDEGITTNASSEVQSSINSKVLLLVYVSIASFALIYIYIVCWNLTSQRLAQRIRERYLRNLLKQDVAFFDKLQAGEVSSRLNGDIQILETGTSEKVGIFLACLSFCITAYIIAFMKDAKLAGILLSLIPAFIIMTVVGGTFVQRYSGKMSEHLASASALASEGLNHVGLVHALCASFRLEEIFSGYLGNARAEGIKKASAAAIQAGLLYFIAFSANALAYWQGSRKIANTVQFGNDDVTIGDTYTVIFILVDGAIVLSQVAPLLPLFGAAFAAFERLRKDMDHKPSIDGSSDTGDKPPSTNGKIEFCNVSFTYPSRPEHAVLRNVSFKCAPGEMTAIVGLSGSGKSTVASLMTRLYDSGDGTIMLDGRDIRSLNVRALRSFISLVPQDSSLLNRSILENIAFGLMNSPAHSNLRDVLQGDSLSRITEAARAGQNLVKSAEWAGPEVFEIFALVQRAADLADAMDFIEKLEHGLATLVGSSGSLVSGGQKQRIVLARALVRDPRILVLDEATSALDSVSEQKIQRAIEKAAQGRTVISIAHRLSTIKAASNIIVMKTGTIIEQGSHLQLIDSNGAYAEMVRLQSVQPTDDAENGTGAIQGKKDVEIIEKNKPASATDEKAGATTSPDDFDKVVDDADGCSVIQTILPMIQPYGILLLVAFVAAAIVGGTYPGSGVIFGNTIGALSPCEQPASIRSRGLLFSGLFFMLACIEFLANFTSWSMFGLISERLMYKVRLRSFRTLFDQPLQWHQSNGRSPEILLSFITKDGNALAGFSGSIVGTLFSVVINFIVAIVLSHIIAWRIAIICLVTVPLLLGAGFMQLRSIAHFRERHASAFLTSIAITVEAVSNIRTIAALSIEAEIMQTYRRTLKAPRKEMVMQSIKSNVWLAIANSTGNIIYAFAYWWGAKQILEGRYTQTQFFIILVAMLVSAQLWGQMFTLAPELSRAKSAISRIVGLLSLETSLSQSRSGMSTPDPDNLDEKGADDIEANAASPILSILRHGAAVEFRQVSFSYPARPKVTVINSLSLSIHPGQFCALVGPSGAGKTTIFALLERFYNPSSGSILLDGDDISRRTTTSFREEIAYVPQDNVLFQGTIKFNVSLGARPYHSPTDADVEEACKLAGIHDAIMSLPDGYQTDCGSNGSQLSGGQRQRLSIARALIRKPRLLLLDESTSALDAESERAFEMGLDKAVKGNGVTVIAIAHRLRTIVRADVIFMIDTGRVIDQGRHEDLVQRSERYRVNALHQMME
ncbi:leptomycin B resistance protein pmd1 [Lindgomyces ingoldianus]|uniref:Leptomycin B resistance protein pmd1 n=1 Tax=Lindgomyces ingoldianus TaxID=673940 RepID=A0ACB6QQQ0_9PLEO|nr:leptomycin B resistance protein pmd1 [Lindgomyces ingoldianus]KAF2468425.1 leptomycin B resistance protein pmd1 [Lindgomyces ingoldianus]